MKIKSATGVGAFIVCIYFAEWVINKVSPPEPQCYVQTNADPFVAKWMDCSKVPAEWTVIEKG